MTLFDEAEKPGKFVEVYVAEAYVDNPVPAITPVGVPITQSGCVGFDETTIYKPATTDVWSIVLPGREPAPSYAIPIINGTAEEI